MKFALSNHFDRSMQIVRVFPIHQSYTFLFKELSGYSGSCFLFCVSSVCIDFCKCPAEPRPFIIARNSNLLLGERQHLYSELRSSYSLLFSCFQIVFLFIKNSWPEWPFGNYWEYNNDLQHFRTRIGFAKCVVTVSEATGCIAIRQC